jgi:predicted TIM-barrel fold metal-dependent hydrolase
MDAVTKPKNSDFPSAKPADQPIDMHVHIVGNGAGGTGCWLRLDGWHWPLGAFMVRHIGLPVSVLKGDLDALYIEKLLEMVRGSSLGAVAILAQEQVYDEHGKLMKDFGTLHVPNDYVLDLARRHREFLPAVSIHPARADALEELERCLERGAVMLKILPNCHNIDCNNPRYRKFWERMAEAGLPLLAHTGGEHTMQVVRKEYSDPRNLRLPLECGVKVIAAHCGTKSGLFDPQYFFIFADMIEKYPNLYGDNSAFNVPIRGRHVRRCLAEPMASRMIHGSDFPVPVYGAWSWLKGLVDWPTFRRWDTQPNVLERDYQLKRAMGFSEESFTRIRSLWRCPAG